MRDIDINRIPWEMEEEYCNYNNNNNNVEEEEDDDSLYGNGNGNGNGRCSSSSHLKKKLRLTKEQSFLLEDTFRLNKTLNPKQKEVLAVRLKLKPRQVEVWFQNRRARSKQKQTEVECDYLKRWFTSLSEQNKRLHKEVEELRAIQLIPPHIPPAGASSTPPIMTMCPRCQRVTTDVHHHHAGAITTVAATTPASAAGINWLKMDL